VLVGLAGFGIAPRTWVPTARMLVPRTHHTATLLPDGRVLVAGGDNEDVLGGSLASVSAELYDPRTGTWTATGSMHTPRECHTATLLPDGKVLVAGGGDSECQGPLTSAELYDPATDRWTATGSMGAGRLFHTATLLRNGKVLVAGGCDDPNCLTALASAELYDPATDRWTATGSMSAARGEHTATLLPNGKVLVAGGREPDIRSSSELYDPATGTWTATGNMTAPRYSYTATLLPDGKVLAAGGGSDNAACGSSPVCYAPTNSAELYDPATGTWAATGSMSSIRGYHTATLLPTNGRVLVTGGSDSGPGRALSSTELYDSVTGRWRPGARMLAARDEHTATLLSDGTLLVAGGEDNGYGIVAPMAELYMTR
jgi:N-acetylneuraminic acid mutarotase